MFSTVNAWPTWPALDRSAEIRRVREESARRSEERRRRQVRAMEMARQAELVAALRRS